MISLHRLSRWLPYWCCAVMCLLFAERSLSAADLASAVKQRSAKKTVRLLTIGNSFSQDATTFLSKLASADGNELVLKTANIGGSPMQLHWDKSQIHERDPLDKAGHYGSGKGLKQLLLDGPHDFITIQQRSYSSHDVATYRPYAANLKAYVKKHAPNAELLLHETWAYRVDDKRFTTPSSTESGPRSQREMYDQLAKAYRTIAKELDVRLIPVGSAFIAADTDPKWSFKVDVTFNPKQAKSPLLPDQKRSLHVGYKWGKGTTGEPALSMDGHHASPAGRYLGACVWYEVLFATTCVGNVFTADLDPDYALFLQTTAHNAVAATK